MTLLDTYLDNPDKLREKGIVPLEERVDTVVNMLKGEYSDIEVRRKKDSVSRVEPSQLKEMLLSRLEAFELPAPVIAKVVSEVEKLLKPTPDTEKADRAYNAMCYLVDLGLVDPAELKIEISVLVENPNVEQLENREGTLQILDLIADANGIDARDAEELIAEYYEAEMRLSGVDYALLGEEFEFATRDIDLIAHHLRMGNPEAGNRSKEIKDKLVMFFESFGSSYNSFEHPLDDFHEDFKNLYTWGVSEGYSVRDIYRLVKLYIGNVTEWAKRVRSLASGEEVDGKYVAVYSDRKPGLPVVLKAENYTEQDPKYASRFNAAVEAIAQMEANKAQKEQVRAAVSRQIVNIMSELNASGSEITAEVLLERLKESGRVSEEDMPTLDEVQEHIDGQQAA